MAGENSSGDSSGDSSRDSASRSFPGRASGKPSRQDDTAVASTLDERIHNLREAIAFEIETGNSDAPANVRKCLAAGMDRVVVVATSQAARQKLARVLPPDSRAELLRAPQALERASW